MLIVNSLMSSNPISSRSWSPTKPSLRPSHQSTPGLLLSQILLGALAGLFRNSSKLFPVDAAPHAPFIYFRRQDTPDAFPLIGTVTAVLQQALITTLSRNEIDRLFACIREVEKKDEGPLSQAETLFQGSSLQADKKAACFQMAIAS